MPYSCKVDDATDKAMFTVNNASILGLVITGQ